MVAEMVAVKVGKMVAGMDVWLAACLVERLAAYWVRNLAAALVGRWVELMVDRKAAWKAARWAVLKAGPSVARMAESKADGTAAH